MSGITGYAAGLAAVAAAALARLALWPLLGNSVPYLTYLPATVFAAWFAGAKPGYLAAFAGGTAGYLLLVYPAAGFRTTDIFAYALFLGVNVMIVGFIGSLWRARFTLGKARNASAWARRRPKWESGRVI